MRKHLIALTAGLALAAGCVDKTIVYPEGTPTVDALAGDLTAAGVQTLALGDLRARRVPDRSQRAAIRLRDAGRPA
jgi:hypothetical protein